MCNVEVIPIRYLSVCIMYVCMHVSRTSCKKNMHNLAINVNITSSLPLGAIAPYSFLFADAALAAALAVASCMPLQLVAGSKRCLPGRALLLRLRHGSIPYLLPTGGQKKQEL